MRSDTPTSITVIIVDDQAMIRTGFRLFLESQPDITVVAEAGDGAEAVALTAHHRPDVVLMDVRMPRMDGLEAARNILAAGQRDVRPHSRVLMLTTYDLDGYVYQALRSGASGFLLKDASAHALAEAVRVVAAGESIIAPSVTRRLIAQFVELSPKGPPRPTDVPELTERERDVLVLVARGLSNSAIAEHLVVSEHTVKTHFTRILTKIGARDRAQAIIHAYERGLVRPGGQDQDSRAPKD